MERRKVKNGEKGPRGQCLTRPVPNGRRRSCFWLVPENLFFLHQSDAGTAATVWNWSGKTLSPVALLAVLYFSSFHTYFSARLDFPSLPLSAPWSPRMGWPLVTDDCWRHAGAMLVNKNKSVSLRWEKNFFFHTNFAKINLVLSSNMAALSRLWVTEITTRRNLHFIKSYFVKMICRHLSLI